MTADSHQRLVQLDARPAMRTFVQHVRRERRETELVDRVVCSSDRNQQLEREHRRTLMGGRPDTRTIVQRRASKLREVERRARAESRELATVNRHGQHQPKRSPAGPPTCRGP